MAQIHSNNLFATQETQQVQPMQPLSVKQAIPLFAIPAIMVLIAQYWGIPFFESLGYPPLTSFLAAMMIPMALLLVAALYGFHNHEGNPLTLNAFCERMRYPALKWRDIGLVVIIMLVGILGSGLMSPIAMLLSDAGLIPQNLPALVDPNLTPEALHLAAGGTLNGNWEILLLYAVYLVFNIIGEEFWWRGYILPRQELAHGRWTWLIHGTMWTLFHAFIWWEWAGILPLALAMAYVSQRTKSNWASTLAHLIGNVALYLMVVGGFFGAF